MSEEDQPLMYWKVTSKPGHMAWRWPWRATLQEQVYEDEIGRIVVRDDPDEGCGSLVTIEDKTDPTWRQDEKIYVLTHAMYVLGNYLRYMRPQRPHLIALAQRADAALKQDRVRQDAATARYWRDRLSSVR